MTYIDGFAVAVPSDKKQDYINHAKMAADILKDYGALKIVECWGDDVPDGKVTSFPQAVQKQENETVCFSWIEWPSREVRNDAMPKFMADERLDMEKNPMPFDGKRMIFGGFEVILEV